jgi:hypothetical protein
MLNVITFAWAVTAAVTAAAPAKHAQVALTPGQIFQRCSPAVVSIITTVDGNSAERGSGTVVAPNGVVITSAHVLTNAESILVEIGLEEPSVASLRYYDEESDLAVLHIAPSPTQGLVLRRQDLKVGERIYALGNPQGLRRSISEGIVSGLRHDVTGTLIQHTAAISPGSSGGPLLSSSGQMVGVNTFLITESQNLNFAISARQITTVLNAAAAASEDLPMPAIIRRQRLDPMIAAAYDRADYRALADLATEALNAKLQPAHYYSALAGIAYVEIGSNTEAQPLLEAAVDARSGDSPSKQTARWYLLKSLFDRFLHQNETDLKGEIASTARAFLSSSEGTLHGDAAAMRKSATDILEMFSDPTGRWYDASGGFLRMFKTNILRVRCEPSRCYVEVLQHPEARNAGMHDTTLGSGTVDGETFSGSYTIFLTMGSEAGWKQNVSFALKWSESYDALEGTVTYHSGESSGTVPEGRAFFQGVLYPTKVSVRLVPLE